MNTAERRFGSELIRIPEYRYANPNTLIFITGAPLSGKSTIAPLVASCIEGGVLQPMDIIRLMAQEIETHKPESERNPFVNTGSCDSYTLISDGAYNSESLIEGFNLYCKAVGGLLSNIVPKLEAQGAQDIIFEGVQLSPNVISPYLVKKNKLVIMTTSPERFESNRNKMFSGSDSLLERYSVDRLTLIQEEILRQSNDIPKDKLITVDNSDDYIGAASEIVGELIKDAVIVPK